MAEADRGYGRTDREECDRVAPVRSGNLRRPPLYSWIAIVLSDEQIERYSRQIILPEVGGRGQERLLSATVTLVGETEDLVPALNYLAGAGIGRIVIYPCGDHASQSRLAALMRELNPDVTIELDAQHARTDQTWMDQIWMDQIWMDQIWMILAGSGRVLDIAGRINQAPGAGRIVFARLDQPYLIAVLASRSPCLQCAHPSLLAAIDGPGAFASAIAMAAAVETIKGLLAVAPDHSRLIEFSGYGSRSIKLVEAPLKDCRVCG